jgi:hypothetical protein
MVKPGASYQPELIELMKTALDEATNTLPVARQTSDMKLKLASRILSAAARGVSVVSLRITSILLFPTSKGCCRAPAGEMSLKDPLTGSRSTQVLGVRPVRGYCEDHPDLAWDRYMPDLEHPGATRGFCASS